MTIQINNIKKGNTMPYYNRIGQNKLKYFCFYNIVFSYRLKYIIKPTAHIIKNTPKNIFVKIFTISQ